ncbi:hypothetical protein J3459_011226 [Metarhizium acridum]|nr:hypothetical protein J3459_011226 [Metarhizium acridum]
MDDAMLMQCMDAVGNPKQHLEDHRRSGWKVPITKIWAPTAMSYTGFHVTQRGVLIFSFSMNGTE